MPLSVFSLSSLKKSVLKFHQDQLWIIIVFGIASGLPYVMIAGTVGAWLTTQGIKPSTIGLLSWTSLAYAFKFMWAPALQNLRTPLHLPFLSKHARPETRANGQRFCMGILQILIAACFIFLAFSDPSNNILALALISLTCAVLSASFDIILSAWRIQTARDSAHLDMLSSLEQGGYRAATLIGGAGALFLVPFLSWPLVFLLAGLIMAASVLATFCAKTTPITSQTTTHKILETQNVPPRVRAIATTIVLMGWGYALFLIGVFMVGSLSDSTAYNPGLFIRTQGPIIIICTIIILGIIASVLAFLYKDENTSQSPQTNDPEEQFTQIKVLDTLYTAILTPMIELVQRLGWQSVLILSLALSYRFTDAIWGAFAYPFYLGLNYGALGHTLIEVGLASKLIGVCATIFGIILAGFAMIRFGRMPVLFLGAVLAALTNLLFADLARGAPMMDAFLALSHLDIMFAFFGQDIRMARLISAILAENIAGGVASAAFVAYLSSIVNKKYASVQYALVGSLALLIGVLGRPAIGEVIEKQGFATAFIICTALGVFAVFFCILLWVFPTRNHNS